MKRKILLVFTLLMMVLAQSCFAADWYWLESNDEATFYVDRSSAHWINRTQLSCTQKMVEANGDYSISDIVFDYARRPRVYERLDYLWSYNADSTCKVASSFNDGWEPLAPDSIGESCALKIYDLFVGHRKY